ncbi:hypothetical protein IPN41_03760 [Candidatus Falkowbacteria bacterium]|nr:MAG: hypothetical protein IPN41_03760 [Candidatus Falkowbacteria bacterium]
MEKFIVLDLKGNDISEKVVVYTGPSDPAYHRKLASMIFKKADNFYEDEILSKRLDLTNEEWFQKHSEYKEMMRIGGAFEDKELASICKNIIHYLSEKSDNPLLAKVGLTTCFKEIFTKMPEVSFLI